jgi:hypothetical protein
MASGHPEYFPSFVAGWENLGPIIQANWLSKALISPKDLDHTPSYWSSWVPVRLRKMRIGRDLNHNCYDTSDLSKAIATKIRQKMSHSGQLFGIPFLPSNEEFLIPQLVGSEVIASFDRFGRDEGSMCDEISQLAANAIVNAELSLHIRSWLEKWRKDIEEIGLQAVQKHWPAPKNPPKLEPRRLFRSLSYKLKWGSWDDDSD